MKPAGILGPAVQGVGRNAGPAVCGRGDAGVFPGDQAAGGRALAGRQAGVDGDR